MNVWLTVDGERRGPYCVMENTEGEIMLYPLGYAWLTAAEIEEELTRMGIVEMRLK